MRFGLARLNLKRAQDTVGFVIVEEMCLLHGFQLSNNVFHGTCLVQQQNGLHTDYSIEPERIKNFNAIFIDFETGH